ncbi:Uncharacterized protein Fot_54036 [Forsythia ovata]|uniref:Uncharacterized protein n=1 Tax=Forsythia ovata TaxID=205694 RepID=A0ABD1PFW6_9LAMI
MAVSEASEANQIIESPSKNKEISVLNALEQYAGGGFIVLLEQIDCGFGLRETMHKNPVKQLIEYDLNNIGLDNLSAKNMSEMLLDTFLETVMKLWIFQTYDTIINLLDPLQVVRV